jgi:hypothetical protein
MHAGEFYESVRSNNEPPYPLNLKEDAIFVFEEMSSPTYHYVRLFQNNPKIRFFLGWNWGAFFFSSGWILYRQMYGIFLLLFLFNLTCSFLFGHSFFATLCIMFVENISIALLGDYAYMASVREAWKKKQRMNPDMKWALAVFLCAQMIGLVIVRIVR